MNFSLVSRVLDLAVAIQQIPAPTFSEEKRIAFIKDKFQQEGLSNVSVDEVGNVYARLPGEGAAAPLVFTAHVDTVFPTSVELKVARTTKKITGPGIGDNSLGVAALFGLSWLLECRGILNQRRSRNSESQVRTNLPGDVWLVANVGEEGLGDLCGMRSVVKRFGERVSGYVVLEGLALGQVYHRGLAVKRYRITASTPGGHSWVDHGKPSAVHELAALVNQLLAIPTPSRPRSSLNVGVISGGTSVNTVAPEAFIELDLRSEDESTLAKLAAQIEYLVKVGNKGSVRESIEVIGDRPAGEVSADHPLVRVALQSLERVGIPPTLNIGSTDANFPLSMGLPAICLGLSTGGKAHTVNEFIHTEPLRQGLEQLEHVVEGVYSDIYVSAA